MRNFVGSRYDINLSITDIAKAVREHAKTNDILKECKFSITISRASMCQDLHVALMSAPKEVFVDTTRKSMQGAHYHKEPLTLYGQLVIETITEYANKKNVLILDKRPLDLTDAVPVSVKSQEETDLFGEIPDLLNLAGE